MLNHSFVLLECFPLIFINTQGKLWMRNYAEILDRLDCCLNSFLPSDVTVARRVRRDSMATGPKRGLLATYKSAICTRFSVDFERQNT